MCSSSLIIATIMLLILVRNNNNLFRGYFPVLNEQSTKLLQCFSVIFIVKHQLAAVSFERVTASLLSTLLSIILLGPCLRFSA
jgi:hypothetical protein